MSTQSPAESEPRQLSGPRISSEQRDAGAGSMSAPRDAAVLNVEGALEDDAVFRRFVARHLATQTLSQQRAEWYARSTRLHFMAAFWIGAICAVITVILLIVLTNSLSPEESSSLYYG